MTDFAEVVLYEYRVAYYRVDGNPNVPDPFTVQFTGRVPPGGTYDHETIVLRREAKLLPSLKNLAFGGGEGSIDLHAVIDFFGEDLLGNHVSVRYVLFIRVMDVVTGAG